MINETPEQKIERLHERCKKLSSGELIVTLFQIEALDLFQNKTSSEQITKIFKTYLVRALIKDGYR